MWLGAAQRITKKDIQLVEQLANDYAKYCKDIWRVDFHFDHYDPEVNSFYVRDLRMAGREKLRYAHLVELEKQIQQKYSKRCRVGIIYEEVPYEQQ